MQINKELFTCKRGEHVLYLILHETNERTYDDCSLLGDQRWQLITADINQLFVVRSFVGQDWTITHMILPEYKLSPNSNILLHSTYIHCAALSHKDLCQCVTHMPTTWKVENVKPSRWLPDRLPTTGGHNHQAVLPFEDLSDNLFLKWTERWVSKEFLPMTNQHCSQPSKKEKLQASQVIL